MTQKKKSFFIIGGLLFVFLSFILVLMYDTEPIQQQPDSAANDLPPANEGDASSSNMESINITSDDNDDATSTIGNNTIDEDELKQYAKEAIEEASLTDTLSEPSERSFFEHAYLYQYYSNLMGERLSEDEEMEDEADWVAKELAAWYEMAGEIGDFNYSESEFIQYVSEQNFLVEEDIRTVTLLNELRNKSETLYNRQLEYHYMRLFIWESIQDQLAENNQQNPDEAEEDYLQRLYREFEGNVTEYLIEKYPELLEE